MKPLLLFALAATLSAESGIRARATASDYPAHQTGAGAAVGAAVLTPEQAKKLFAVDVTKLGYTVVEIGMYPERDVEVAARDFLLRVAADGATLRPVVPSAIAAKLDKKSGHTTQPTIPAPVQVYGSQTVGYGTGSYGGRRTGGVFTESTVGVGVGGPGTPPPPPPSSSRHGKDKDALSVQVELEQAALPEGRWGHPVAGYLYFPTPPKKASLELTWYAADGQVRLSLPAVK